MTEQSLGVIFLDDCLVNNFVLAYFLGICSILGLALFQTNKGYDLLQAAVYALGAVAGFTLALILMAGIRARSR